MTDLVNKTMQTMLNVFIEQLEKANDKLPLQLAFITKTGTIDFTTPPCETSEEIFRAAKYVVGWARKQGMRGIVVGSIGTYEIDGKTDLDAIMVIGHTRQGSCILTRCFTLTATGVQWCETPSYVTASLGATSPFNPWMNAC